MKKRFIVVSFLILLLSFASISIFEVYSSQTEEVLLLEFNFENEEKRDSICDCNKRFSKNSYSADSGSDENKASSSLKIVGAKFNGFVDAGTFKQAASGNSWQNGSDSKYWQISFSTIGEYGLKLSSKQRSSNTGPRDFKVQWSLDGVNWTDVIDAIIEVKDSWALKEGTLENVFLPFEINNQEEVFLRWIMTSNVSVEGGTVGSQGTSQIDDIKIEMSSDFLAAWDFENSDKVTSFVNSQVYEADEGIFSTSSLLLIGASSISGNNASVNGSRGKALNSNDWINGENSKYWQATFSSLGSQDLKLLSKQGGSNTGPRDFQLQWSLDGESWNTITNIAIKNNWTSGVLNESLPAEINNQEEVFLRWIMISNVSVEGGTVGSQGTNRIDDIIIERTLPDDACVACWNFENEEKVAVITDSNTSLNLNPYTADDGTENNKNKAIISLIGARFKDFFADGKKNSANSEKWDNLGENYWQIKFSSLGFENLKLSSSQFSTDAGPRDFKVQWSLDGLTWGDIASSSVEASNNWSSGTLNNINLPGDVNNKSQVFLRWITNSDTSVNGGGVGNTGTNRIDNIVIKASVMKPIGSPNSGSSLPSEAFLSPSLVTENKKIKGELVNDDNLIKINLNHQDYYPVITSFAVSSSTDFSLVDIKSIENYWAEGIIIDNDFCFNGDCQIYLKLFTSWGQSTEIIEMNIKQDNFVDDLDKSTEDSKGGGDLEGLIYDKQLASYLAGKILLQTDNQGEAWYVNPNNQKRYYLGKPADAFAIMRKLSLGVSELDFSKFLNTKVPNGLAGRILLRPEINGEAYYVNPADLKMYYLGRPSDAFRIMQELSLGVSNSDINKIEVGFLVI